MWKKIKQQLTNAWSTGWMDIIMSVETMSLWVDYQLGNSSIAVLRLAFSNLVYSFAPYWWSYLSFKLGTMLHFHRCLLQVNCSVSSVLLSAVWADDGSINTNMSTALVMLLFACVMQKSGENVSEDQLHEILSEVDANKNAQVDLGEFLQVALLLAFLLVFQSHNWLMLIKIPL